MQAHPMDSLPPSQGGNFGGSPPGKDGAGDRQRIPSSNRQEVVDIFGVDMYTAAFTLVLVMLGLVHASMTRCVCL